MVYYTISIPFRQREEAKGSGEGALEYEIFWSVRWTSIAIKGVIY